MNQVFDYKVRLKDGTVRNKRAVVGGGQMTPDGLKEHYEKLRVWGEGAEIFDVVENKDETAPPNLDNAVLRARESLDKTVNLPAGNKPVSAGRRPSVSPSNE